jgi:anthranilate synthase component I
MPTNQLSASLAYPQPIIKELPINNLNPLQVYANLRRYEGDSILLESVKGKDNIGRYSFLAARPFLTFKSKGEWIEIVQDGKRKSFSGNPMEYLRNLMDSLYQPPLPGYPPFLGGAIGYLSYDLCHFFEELPCTTVDDLELPDCYFLVVDSVIVFDHLENKVFLASRGLPETDLTKASAQAEENIERLEEALRPKPHKPEVVRLYPKTGGEIQSNFTQRQFEEMVLRAKEYIRAGDIFQANLSQRLAAPLEGDYLELYKKLRKINPSPFACYLELEGLTVASCSPERLVRLNQGMVETRPIAGTRPRGKNHQEDEALWAELIINEKERAEHIMLVDLERNDLGRICEYGSVRVDELMVIEDYSHVFHIVSNIQGDLRPGLDFADVIRACFPGGTITGTPKIRSMEIIDELEPTRRGLYTGSIGYISFSGEMDLNIVIRTFIIKDGMAYIQVGSGIVADSVPEREYHETLYKAQALVNALHSDYS